MYLYVLIQNILQMVLKPLSELIMAKMVLVCSTAADDAEHYHTIML